MRFPATLRRSFFLGFKILFFCFLTIFFPQSHTLTQTRFTRPNNKQRIRNIQNRRDIRASQGEAVAHDRANHQVLLKERKKRESKNYSLFFFFSFCPNGTPSFFLLGGACALLRFLRFRFAFLLLFHTFVLLFSFSHSRCRIQRERRRARARERVCVD